MKKFVAFLGIALLAIACQKAIVPELTVTTPDQTVSADSGTVTIEFTTNVAWTASINGGNWATLSATSGEAGNGKIKVAVLKNDDPDPREASVTISAAGTEQTKTATVKITQLQKNAIVTPDVDILVGCDAQDVNIALQANVDYTLTPSVSWITVVKTKGMTNYTAVVHVEQNKGAARTGSIAIKGEGVNAEVTIQQAEFVPYFEVNGIPEEGYFVIGQPGGELSFSVKTNVAYDVHFDEYQWDYATMVQDGDNYTVTLDANNDSDIRHFFLKLTTPEIKEWVDTDWDGEDDTERDLTVYVVAYQDGLSTVMYEVPLTSFGDVATVGGLHRLGYANGKLLLSDGTDVHVLDADNGAYIGKLGLPEGVVPESMTIDDGGNILIAANAPFEGEFRVYAAELSENLDAQLLISYTHADIYSNMLANLRVTGDISKEAVVCAFTDLYVYCVYWDIKDGVASEVNWVALPTEADWDNWSGIVWNAARNGVVVPAGTNSEAGFYYTAYDGIYGLWHVDKDGTAKQILYNLSDSNTNLNAMDFIEWKGMKLVAIEFGQFFSWGDCPNFIVADVTDPDEPEFIGYFYYDYAHLNTEYLGVNDGENASSDIMMVPNGDTLEVYVVDALANILYRVDYPVK